jgi:hypothetical protein
MSRKRSRYKTQRIVVLHNILKHIYQAIQLPHITNIEDGTSERMGERRRQERRREERRGEERRGEERRGEEKRADSPLIIESVY